PWRGAGLVAPAAPQIDHHLAVDVDGERGTEVFPRLELGGEQLAQGVEAGTARAAQRRRAIVHEAPVQKSRRKRTPLGRGGLQLTVLLPNDTVQQPAHAGQTAKCEKTQSPGRSAEAAGSASAAPAALPGTPGAAPASSRNVNITASAGASVLPA